VRNGQVEGGSKLFAQVDAHLDTLPKIVKAGRFDVSHSRFAREVYEFVLRRNWIHGARGGVPGHVVDTWYMSRMLFMPEPEAKIGLVRALEVRLLGLQRNGVPVPIVDDRYEDALRVVTERYESLRVTDDDWIEIVGWDQLWSRIPRTNAARQKAYRDRKGKEPLTEGSDDSLRSVVTRYDSNGIDQIRRDLEHVDQEKNTVPTEVGTSRKRKADKIDDRAWRAADALRTMVLGMFPSANVGARPWDGEKRPPFVIVAKEPGRRYAKDLVEVPDLAKKGNRLKWADEIRKIVELDGRKYEEIWETLQWLRYGQPAGVNFIVQSPMTLREKWGQIWAHIKAPDRKREQSENAVDGAVAEIAAAMKAAGS